MTDRQCRKIASPLHKKKHRRLEFLCKPTGEARDVVKGPNRRVVVVRSPDERIFEQAIFIIRDDYLQTEQEGSKRLLEEARRAAAAYAARARGPYRRRIFRPVYAAAGAAAALIAWLAVRFAGVLF